MSNSTSHILPYPIRKARYSLQLPFNTSAGTPTDPTTPDTEFSTDGGATSSDCAEEITTGSTNGIGYLTLTGAETDNALLSIIAKSANCVTTRAFLHPRNLPTIGSGTLSAGSAGGGTLGTLLAYDVTNCFIRTTGGTGGGGTGGANNQARRILTYNTSTGAFTCANWETTPSTDTTYDVLLPEGVTLGMLKTLNPTTAGNTLDVSSGGEAGLDWANIGSKTTTNALTGTTLSTSQHCIVDSGTVTTVTNQLTAAQIATGVWQDATSGDFTVSSSIGKSLYTSGVAPGGAGGIFIAGTNTGPLSVSGGVTFSNSGGDALALTSSGGNGNGLNATGNGSGSGLLATAGATGHGGKFVGGSSSGNGIDLGVTSGHGLNTVASGTSKNGINALGSSTSGNGVLFTGRGTGHGLAAVSGAGATGDGINATAASTNGNGFAGYGTGTGDGAMFTGGLTGRGVHFVGGGTSGDGVYVETTSGHGINLAPVGTNKHGLFATGGNGGTSDGIKAAAGTGGVDIRGNITGNLTGTVATVTNLTNAPTSGDFTATMKTSIATAVDASATGVLAAGATGFAAIAGYIDTEVAAIKAKTDNLPSDPADASDIAAAFSTVNSTLTTIAGYVDTEVAAIKAKTDNLPASPASTSDVTSLLTTAMTESYSADGAAPTPAQALFAILQRLTEFAITSTTISVKKLDGTTEAFTLTLDSATSPTSSTRAT